jgi:hypothetical protein
VGLELTDLLLEPCQTLLYLRTFSLERVYDLLNTRHHRLLKKLPLTACADLLSVARSAQLARLLRGQLVALRNLLTQVIEGDGRG